ncbi:MAG TPA: hypothetical protein VIU41_07940 [Geobacteraceae bacterium]
MPRLAERLRTCTTLDPQLMTEAAAELADLQQRVDALELVLLMLVRTGWPWQEDGTPSEILHHCRDGYGPAMREARQLLGLETRSVLTRTEPKT